MSNANFHKHVNANYIVDISKLEYHFFKNYFDLRDAISMYITYILGVHVCLSTSTDSEIKGSGGPDAFIDVFQMENQYYNKFYDLISRNVINEKQALATINDNRVLPREILNRSLDDIHDVLDRHIFEIVSNVINNYDRYVGKIVLVSPVLVNQHTLLVSFKTISMENRNRT